MGNTLVKKKLLGVGLRARVLRDTEAGGGGGTGGDDGSGAGGDDDTGGDEGSDDDDDPESTATEPKGGKKTPTPEDYERVQRHLSNADRKKEEFRKKAETLEAELKALRDKDLPEAERIKAEHEAAVKERDAFRSRFETMARTNAFLMASADAKIAWANASDALRVGDLDDLEIEDDGTVPGMVEAVKELAKKKPYLLAPKDSTDTKETPPKSGSVVGSKNKGKKPEGEYTPEELKRLFPALRT